jgi:hypothetical protein
MVDDDEVGHAERVTLPRALWRNSGARTVRRAGPPGRGLAQQAVGVPLRVVAHAEAHPFEVGMRGASKRSAPTTAGGSKTAHANFLITLSSSPPPPGPTPPGQSTVFTEREPTRASGPLRSRQ